MLVAQPRRGPCGRRQSGEIGLCGRIAGEDTRPVRVNSSPLATDAWLPVIWLKRGTNLRVFLIVVRGQYDC